MIIINLYYGLSKREDRIVVKKNKKKRTNNLQYREARSKPRKQYCSELLFEKMANPHKEQTELLKHTVYYEKTGNRCVFVQVCVSVVKSGLASDWDEEWK